MRIWWGFRMGKEAMLIAGMSFIFLGGGGYAFNFRKRYPWHKQKRERSDFRNPYFVPVNQRQLKYDKNFNVIKNNGKLFIEQDLKI